MCERSSLILKTALSRGDGTKKGSALISKRGERLDGGQEATRWPDVTL